MMVSLREIINISKGAKQEIDYITIHGQHKHAHIYICIYIGVNSKIWEKEKT